MSINPALKKLGYSEGDRVLIFHADDVGCCQASVDAYADLVDFGLLSSGAVMAPCPWFPAVADYCRANADNDRIDLGVHLTLTSEYEGYRWGPISTRRQASGMLDEEGCFYRTSAAVKEYGDPAAVKCELEAQIERVIHAGIDITHIDSHMGSAFHPKFWASYVELAHEYGVPCYLRHRDREELKKRGYDEEQIDELLAIVDEAEADGLPVFDYSAGIPLDPKPLLEDRLSYVKDVLSELKPGLTNFICHPVRDTPEVRSMTGSWAQRANDRDILASEELREFVEDQDIHVIGYRALKELM